MYGVAKKLELKALFDHPGRHSKKVEKHCSGL